MSSVVIGVDGGGTKTTTAVALIDGTIIGQARTGPSNYQVVGLERAVAAITDGCRTVLDHANIDPGSVRAVWAGLAGVNTYRDAALLQEAIKNYYSGFVAVDNDAYNCLSAVTEGYGIAVIAGTGSIAVGANRQGARARVGGWGYILGDEGSGYDVGRKALQAVCRCLDGRGPETSLVRLLFGHLGARSGDDLYEKIYCGSGMQRHEVAAMAVHVGTAAEMGDDVSNSILQGAGSDLGLLAVAVINKLGLAGEQATVALCGGMVVAQPVVVQRLTEVVKKTDPSVNVVRVRSDPVEGAVRMAVQLYVSSLRGSRNG